MLCWVARQGPDRPEQTTRILLLYLLIYFGAQHAQNAR